MNDNTKEIGPFYATVLRYEPEKRPPLIESCWTNEVTPPFRKGRGLSFRLWKGRSLGIGWWTKTLPTSEEAGLLAALEGESLDAAPEEIGEW